MAAVALAIVDRHNNPLYVREFDDGDNDDRYKDEGVLFGLGPVDAHDDRQASLHSGASNECWFALHAALDRLDQLTIAPDSGKKTHPQDNFVGLLVPLGNATRVYGYLTNTNTKFLLIVEDDYDTQTAALEVKRLFGELHELFVQEVMNPFNRISQESASSGGRMSTAFDERVKEHVANFNQQEI